ncbi:glycosyltransferase family 4 protein [Rufibacter hautae]|uniref:Glycosyltransferase family 4 protein n=1 Tax=Rufibacter hautae TaxID=2595005 RepID=A0A5B6TAJ1_9BACT|nr:glycosyltransferase family 4 protein [Rufibacter hautae]KAA3436580.1 glycosyltransferase family 4 protein [Rufibacter hautae]
MKICVVIRTKALEYSETFIQSHINNLHAETLSVQSFPEYIISKGGDFAKQPFIKRYIRNAYHTAKNVLYEKRIKEFLLGNGIDIVLAEYGMTGVKVMPSCKKLNIPLVVHFHGYDAYRKDILDEFKEQYKELFSYAKALIVVSKDMRNQLISLGAPSDKIFYNVYGVDTDRFSEAKVNLSPKQLIAVGRFVEKKAPYLTILSFQKVLDKVPDAKLLMVGSGNLYDICSKIVKSLKLEKSVMLYHSLPHEEIALLMQESRAFVQHSLIPLSGDSEGTPNTILEAQACGLPVVSTFHAGIKDIVINGETGFLLDECDITTMAKYMTKLLEDAELAASLGRKGRLNIVANYTMEKSITNLRKIIESCI